MHSQARRRMLAFTAVAASLVLSATAAAGAYLLLERPSYRMLGSLRQARLVRAYLTNPALRSFARTLASQDPKTDLFATLWDTNTGVLLSRHMFRDVLMDGVTKYKYRANLSKLSFRTSASGLHWNMETEDTPAIRAALADLDTDYIVTASYDESGFRRVDPELTADCTVHALFLGDSFTDGLWVANSDTFVNVFGHIVRQRARTRICPVNAGVNGYGPLEEAHVLEDGFEAAGRPAIVFVMFFANDVDADYAAVINGTLSDRERRWQESLGHLARIRRYAAGHDGRVVLAAIPTAEQVFVHGTQEYYQRVLREFAAREDIRFVNLIDHLSSPDAPAFYWDWDPHFTPRGHRAVAEALYAETADLFR